MLNSITSTPPSPEPNPAAIAEQCGMSRATLSFKGNKQSLPSKPCTVCGRPMTWRKKWAKNWDDVKVCSDGCRKKRGASEAATARS